MQFVFADFFDQPQIWMSQIPKAMRRLSLYIIAIFPFLISCESEEEAPFIPENYEWEIFDMNFESSGEKDVFGSNLIRGVYLFSEGLGKWEFNPHEATLDGIILNDTLFLERGNTYKYSTWSFAKEYPSGKTVQMDEIIYRHHDRYQFFFLGDAFIGNSAPLKFEYGEPNGMRIGLNGLISIKSDAVPDTVTFNLILLANLNKDFPGTDNPHMPESSFAGGLQRLDLSFPVVIK